MTATAANTRLASTDQRVIQTRQKLLESFSELLIERQSIRKISIQAITEHAGLHRVTFYDHFTDKYDLLFAWKREVFRKAVIEKQAQGQSAKAITFEQIIDTVLDFVSSYKRQLVIINKEYVPLFEAAMQEELADIISDVLKTRQQHSRTAITRTAAIFLSCAILGTANEWGNDHIQIPRHSIAYQLLRLVDNI